MRRSSSEESLSLYTPSDVILFLVFVSLRLLGLRCGTSLSSGDDSRLRVEDVASLEEFEFLSTAVLLRRSMAPSTSPALSVVELRYVRRLATGDLALDGDFFLASVLLLVTSSSEESLESELASLLKMERLWLFVCE